jgi:F-type H+-transporting ATPase subunit epsilon
MALPTHIRLEFVSPERTIVHDDVDEVGLPGEVGDFGVLPGHAPMLALLRIGQVWYRKGGETKFAFVAGGAVEVVADRVSVIAQAAERAEDIDLARAEAAKHRAEENLARPVAHVDFERARVALLRAITRLQVSSRVRKRP